jgi:cysteine desulfurase
MPKPIYLDHNATTPLDKRVLDKMIPYFLEVYGNASSIDHLHGNHAKQAVQKAREDIAKILGCRKSNEIIFTSGATESNNLALIGTFRKYRNKGNHIISSAIEHPCVLDTLEFLKTEGAEVTLLPVDKNGFISIKNLEDSIRDNTILISIMFANNEIGTIEPISEIGRIAKANNILFHTDAAQAVGHINVNAYEMNTDMLSFSAHKFYGPKGVGGLFVRTYSPFVKLNPISFGGGHERGMRSGTLNVPGIVGMAEALNIASKEMDKENKKDSKLTKHILTKLKQSFPDIKLNGDQKKRLPHNLNITIPGVENKALIHMLKDKLSFSTGSACTTTEVKPSHVITALGYDEERAYSSIRFGLGRFTTEEEIARTIDVITKTVTKLRNM